MPDRAGNFKFCQVIHVRIGVRTDISISKKTYDNEIQQTGTSREGDLNETSQADVGDVITSRSRDKLKTYIHYQSAYGHQTWQDGKLP